MPNATLSLVCVYRLQARGLRNREVRVCACMLPWLLQEY